MNVLFVTRWGMTEHSFYAFYKDFRIKLDTVPHSPKFLDAFEIKNGLLVALELDDDVKPDVALEKALPDITDVPSHSLDIITTEEFVYRPAERRPQRFLLVTIKGCVEDNAVVWRTYDDLKRNDTKGFNYKPLLFRKEKPGALMLYEGCDKRWVDYISKETQDAVALFESYAGTYEHHPLKIMLCGLPRISKHLDNKAHIVRFKKQIIKSIVYPEFVPNEKWKTTLWFFQSLGGVMNHRKPSDLELIEPIFQGADYGTVKTDKIPVLILFSYRPEIEGKTMTPFDIRETRLWYQHKNESM